ncbi:hypothetical protein FA15DRAFT_757245 [Coprinopsis marcescibilis]|uniref:Uncharacterized protein n=1 Tax=Coprinopsis marcescibilis TaxID=230819 RepID=A0A5C3KTD0_COPMA|nr:hypothetical protein FA15DRAFT_757245 [Coprinopsis marcescibilis]
MFCLFTNAHLRGLNSEKGVVTPTLVKSPLYESRGIDILSSDAELGPEGVPKIETAMILGVLWFDA